MKSLLSNRLVLIIMLTTLFFATGVYASEGDGGLEKVIDGITVHLSFMDKDAQIGTNTVMVALMDASHNPIEDAKVTVAAEMAGDMAGMAGMKPPELLQAEPQSGHDKGQYMAMMNLPDEGKWNITVKIAAGGKESVTDFAIQVINAGPNWNVILGFLGIITAIIVAAAINKKRKAARR
ncbi:MAG: FixH family protein [Desulfoprunum sp.]|nr:FixH family protein [Desulfoprunum sp.]